MSRWLVLLPDVSVRAFSEIGVVVTVRREEPPSVWMGTFQLAGGFAGAQRQKNKFPLANTMKHLYPALGWQNSKAVSLWIGNLHLQTPGALRPSLGLRLRDTSFVCLGVWLSESDRAVSLRFLSESILFCQLAYPGTTCCSLTNFLSTVCRSIINLLTVLTQILVLLPPPQWFIVLIFLLNFSLVLLVRKSSCWIRVSFRQISISFVWFQPFLPSRHKVFQVHLYLHCLRTRVWHFSKLLCFFFKWKWYFETQDQVHSLLLGVIASGLLGSFRGESIMLLLEHKYSIIS